MLKCSVTDPVEKQKLNDLTISHIDNRKMETESITILQVNISDHDITCYRQVT